MPQLQTERNGQPLFIWEGLHLNIRLIEGETENRIYYKSLTPRLKLKYVNKGDLDRPNHYLSTFKTTDGSAMARELKRQMDAKSKSFTEFQETIALCLRILEKY